VLVPALVKTKSGETVFSLTAHDFILTDNACRRLCSWRPIRLAAAALVVIVRLVGRARGICTTTTILEQNSMPSSEMCGISSPWSASTVNSNRTEFHRRYGRSNKNDCKLERGDQGQPFLTRSISASTFARRAAAYRRAVLLVTETADRGSETSLDDAVRSVSDTNTAIYSFGFSTTKAAVKHEHRRCLCRRTPYGNEPYGAGGCMSQDPGADPDAHGDRRVQALDARAICFHHCIGADAFIAAKTD